MLDFRSISHFIIKRYQPNQGRLSEALPLLRGALGGQRTALGNRHPHTLTTMGNLGLGLLNLGQLSEASVLLEEALAGKRMRSCVQESEDPESSVLDELLGEGPNPSHLDPLGKSDEDTLASVNSLGNLYKAMGKFDAAAPLLEEAVSGFRRRLGPEHPSTLNAINNLALLRAAQAKPSPPTPLES